MQIWTSKIKSNKLSQNRIWEGLGLHLKEVGDGPGHLLGGLKRLRPIFCTFTIASFSSIGPRRSPKGLLDRLGVDLGRFGESFGSSRHQFKRLGDDLGNVQGLLGFSFVTFGSQGMFLMEFGKTKKKFSSKH